MRTLSVSWKRKKIYCLFRPLKNGLLRRGNSEFLSIVHDIVNFMSSFLNFEVKFIRRQANSVAHALARAANSWVSFHRFEIIPLCIEHSIANEMH